MLVSGFIGCLAAVAVPASGHAQTVGSTLAPTVVANPMTAEVSPKLIYAARGRFDVGFQQFTTRGAQNRRLKLAVWYPTLKSVDGGKATIRYVAANKFDRGILNAKEITSTGTAVAKAAADVKSGPFPLVVFSHGYGLSPIAFSTLLEHVASHGFVVVGPEHNESFDPSLTGFWKALIDRPADIRKTIDYAEYLTRPGSPLAGAINVSRTAVVGHSYGGYTALAAAGARFDFAAYKARCAPLGADDPLNFFCAPVIPREAQMAVRAGLRSTPKGLWPSLGDERIKAAISMAGDAYPFNERGLAQLNVPLLAMGGTVDEGTPYTWGSKLTYDHAASSSKSLVTFPGAGHLLFVDSCDQMPWTSQFTVYAERFCNDAVWGKKRPLDIVGHYTTAFLLDTLNDDTAARNTLLASSTPKLTNVEYSTNRVQQLAQGQ